MGTPFGHAVAKCTTIQKKFCPLLLPGNVKALRWNTHKQCDCQTPPLNLGSCYNWWCGHKSGNVTGHTASLVELN